MSPAAATIVALSLATMVSKSIETTSCSLMCHRCSVVGIITCVGRFRSSIRVAAIASSIAACPSGSPAASSSARAASAAVVNDSPSAHLWSPVSSPFGCSPACGSVLLPSWNTRTYGTFGPGVLVSASPAVATPILRRVVVHFFVFSSLDPSERVQNSQQGESWTRKPLWSQRWAWSSLIAAPWPWPTMLGGSTGQTVAALANHRPTTRERRALPRNDGEVGWPAARLAAGREWWNAIAMDANRGRSAAGC